MDAWWLGLTGSVSGEEGLSEKAYRLGVEYEKRYHNCAFSTVKALSDALNLGWDWPIDKVYGLAGGVGLTGEGSCGALSGGALILTLLCSPEMRYESISREERYKVYGIVSELAKKFQMEYGGCTCRRVQEKVLGRSFNLWDPEEHEGFVKAGGHEDDKCPSVVGNSAKWVVEILSANNYFEDKRG
ncbi:MAG: C-GCAxxG-C-C family protein [Candidatus Bathyarchaeia archaeon]